MTAAAGVILIADEAHELKNPKASRTQRFRDLSSAVLHSAKGRVYQLTGSPFKNPKDGKFVGRDLWELLENAELGTARFGTIKRFEVCATSSSHSSRRSGSGASA